MPKVKFEPPPPHVVVPDTNILWDEDKKNTVSPAFDEFWKESAPLIRLSLTVPEVVFGELHFQQTTSAIKLAKNISQQIADLSGITSTKYDARLDPQKIRKQVGDKVQKWVKGLKGSIAKTPVDSVDWARVVQDAIWRNEPFTYDPKDKDKDKEKGFRDALILETVVKVCEENKGTTNNVVFLCNDFLLKTAAEKRLKHNPKVLIFESLPEFGAYIKLTQQKLTDKFVKSIQNHARSWFFTANDATTIWYRDRIRKTIRNEFSDRLAAEFESLSNATGLLGVPVPYHWKVINEKWRIRGTRFDELIAPREYHWISQITVAQLVSGSASRGGLAFALMTPREEVRLANFDIKWKADVKADGRFYNVTVIDILETGAAQEPSTEEALDRWGLQPAAAIANAPNPAN